MSDILIRGMEMPKGGYRTVEIAFDADGHPMALADGGDVYDVIPVPDHGRLGDLDALKIYVDNYYKTHICLEASALMVTLNRISPTIIPASE